MHIPFTERTCIFVYFSFLPFLCPANKRWTVYICYTWTWQGKGKCLPFATSTEAEHFVSRITPWHAKDRFTGFRWRVGSWVPPGKLQKHLTNFRRRNMAEISPIRRKTLSNQSINHWLLLLFCCVDVLHRKDNVFACVTSR